MDIDEVKRKSRKGKYQGLLVEDKEGRLEGSTLSQDKLGHESGWDI